VEYRVEVPLEGFPPILEFFQGPQQAGIKEQIELATIILAPSAFTQRVVVYTQREPFQNFSQAQPGVLVVDHQRIERFRFHPHPPDTFFLP
jgi:hypothetical protein